MELPSFVITTGALLLFLIGISIVIFLHEFGHFIVAKWVGIRCDQFAIGFGKAMLSWRKGLGMKVGSTEPEYARRIQQHLGLSDEQFAALKSDDVRIGQAATEMGLGETEYRLNYLPLGGYVKMLGQEDMDPTAMSDNPRAYNQKPIWARMCVISAGVIMNIITAVPIFMVAFLIGVDSPPAVIGGVVPNSPAALAVAVEDPNAVGTMHGDNMLSIDDKPVTDFVDLKMLTALTKLGEKLKLEVRRPDLNGGEGRVLTFNIEPKIGKDGLLSVGIAQAPSLTMIKPKGKASAARFKEVLGKYVEPGATVTTVQGNAVDAFWQFDRHVQASNGQPITITTDAADRPVELPVETAFQVAEVEAGEKKTNVYHLLGLQPAVAIVGVAEKKPADGVLLKGDVIAAVDGRAWPTSRQFRKAIAQSEGDVRLTVVRDGKIEQLVVTPNRKRVIGVELDTETNTAYVSAVLADSPFAAAGIKPGTRISAVNGEAVVSYTDLRCALAEAGAGEINLTLHEPLLGGIERQVAVTLDEQALTQLAALRWTTPLNHHFKEQLVPIQTDSPVEAVALGYHKTKVFLVQTYVMLARLIEGSVPTDKLAGPLGIGRMGTTFAEKGPGHLLYFLGLISVNLAVINFLPLPIVDGGHFVLLIIEKVRGKPLPEPVMNGIMIVGLALLAFVFIYVTKNDIINWSRMGG